MSLDRKNRYEKKTSEPKVVPSRLKVRKWNDAGNCIDFASSCERLAVEGGTSGAREMRRKENPPPFSRLVSGRKQDINIFQEKELTASTEQFLSGTKKRNQQSVPEAAVNNREHERLDNATDGGIQGTVNEKEKHVSVTAASSNQDRRVARREEKTRMEEAISFFPEFFPRGLKSYSLEKPVLVDALMKRDRNSAPVDSGYDEVVRWLELFGLRADVAALLQD